MPRWQTLSNIIPFVIATFLGFLAIGIMLSAVPLYVNNTLGFGKLIVGSVIGVQSLATHLGRPYSGRLCQIKGPKYVAAIGLCITSAAGMLYLLADAFSVNRSAGLAVIFCGRIAWGLGESLFITALSSWSIARVGHDNIGRALSWPGVAMYGGLALGAPIGFVTVSQVGFFAAALVATLLPVMAALLVTRFRDHPAGAPSKRSYLKTLHTIWMPGVGMALGSAGMTIILAFLPLQYQAANWENTEASLAAFGVAYIAMRLLFDWIPDQRGGNVTAVASLLTESFGLFIIWSANSPTIAIFGAALAGVGYSLVFPALGKVAIRLLPDENGGVVLGAYMACFDWGLTIGGPVAGVIAHWYGVRAVFAGGSLAALVGAVILLLFRSSPRHFEI